jgi:hypothetical protein
VIELPTEKAAVRFEKSASGRAFAKRHFGDPPALTATHDPSIRRGERPGN